MNPTVAVDPKMAALIEVLLATNKQLEQIADNLTGVINVIEQLDVSVSNGLAAIADDS